MLSDMDVDIKPLEQKINKAMVAKTPTEQLQIISMLNDKIQKDILPKFADTGEVPAAQQIQERKTAEFNKNQAVSKEIQRGEHSGSINGNTGMKVRFSEISQSAPPAAKSYKPVQAPAPSRDGYSTVSRRSSPYGGYSGSINTPKY